MAAVQDETATAALSQTPPAPASVARSAPTPKLAKAASSVRLHVGNVMVTSKQAGSVFVDSKKIGSTETGGHLLLLQLAYGKHNVEFVLDNVSTQTKRISITSGAPETLSFGARLLAPIPIKTVKIVGYWAIQFENIQCTASREGQFRLRLLSHTSLAVEL